MLCPKEQATEHLWASVSFSGRWRLLANFRVMFGQVLVEIGGVDYTCPGVSVRQAVWKGRCWVCKLGPKELTSLLSGNRQQRAPSSGCNTKCPLYTLLVSWASTLPWEIHIPHSMPQGGAKHSLLLSLLRFLDMVTLLKSPLPCPCIQ